MRLKLFYSLFVGIMHLTMLIISLTLIDNHPVLFVLCEVMIALSLILSGYIFRIVLKPVTLIHEGIDTIRNKDFTVKLAETGQQDIDQLIQVYNSMIDQLREERKGQQEKHFLLERLIESSPGAVVVVSGEGRLISSNENARNLLKIKDGFNDFGSLLHPLKDVYEQLSDGESKIVRTSGIHVYRCYKAHFYNQGFTHYFMIVEELTEELMKIEKSAYEKIIRLMSHEIGNTVGAVNSILQSFLNSDYFQKMDSDSLQDMKQALEVAVERNTHVSSFMTRFADVVKISKPVKVMYDINRLTERVTLLMESSCKARGITLNTSLSAKPLNVSVDVEQIEQVLLNILKNAMEAVEENGWIIVSTDSGKGILTVTDSGQGLSSQSSEQLFSPFFSTKKDGQGIGLTLTREVLRNHGFQFSLKPDDSYNTVFTIHFN